MAPGAKLPLHEHTDIRQTYVIEGRLVDEENEVKAANMSGGGGKYSRRDRA
jgi:anti-sigma factor ChrR (cupin superfamily)